MEKNLREICAQVGVSRRAVQGYEKAGLVSPSGKNKYGHLLYDSEAEERIRLISFFQSAGLSIKDISRIIDAPAEEKKTVLRAQVQKLERESVELQHLIEQLNKYIDTL